MGSLSMQTFVFMAMVVLAVVLLASSVIVPTVGSQAQASRRLKRRIFSVLESIDENTASILRQRFYEDLSPIERFLDVIPGMANFRQIVEQSGVDTKAYRIVVYSVVFALLTFVIASLVNDTVLFSLVLAACMASLPVIYMYRTRNRRLATFEEQLPDALTMMSRALQAGHPFNETIKMIGEEMSDPIAGEFRQVFNDINYGLSSKAAFMSLMTRVPSMSVNTLVIAILIQSESGGRLSEIVTKIAAVIRGRFKLNRKVRALSAEGRLSAWILTLLPFVLALVISITTPSYLPGMIDDPMGRKMIGVSFLFVILGIFWMRRIIRFKY
jgi:tight adherence protein B